MLPKPDGEIRSRGMKNLRRVSKHFCIKYILHAHRCTWRLNFWNPWRRAAAVARLDGHPETFSRGAADAEIPTSYLPKPRHLMVHLVRARHGPDELARSRCGVAATRTHDARQFAVNLWRARLHAELPSCNAAHGHVRIARRIRDPGPIGASHRRVAPRPGVAWNDRSMECRRCRRCPSPRTG